MATRKVKVKPKLPLGPQFPIVVETFQALGAYEIGKLRQDPSCWNRNVSVEKFRITIEKVDEPVEAIHERIKKLWRECENHHHVWPLKSAAAKHGLVLDDDERGTERKDPS